MNFLFYFEKINFVQKLKTRVVKKNLNPVWDEDLTLSIVEPLPVKLVSFYLILKSIIISSLFRIFQSIIDNCTFEA